MADAGASSEKVVRKVRLPADRRTPAAARAVVRSVLEEAHSTELLDAALLLTTELSTNAVVHAGTDLELEVVADSGGLTVMVVDNARGVVAATERPPVGPSSNSTLGPYPPTDLAERGRGLLLVDHFASRWGTTHHRNGKGVWFRLTRDGRPELPGAEVAMTGLAHTGGGNGVVPDAPALNALLGITQDPYAEDPVAEFAKALLTQLVDLVGAGGGVVRCDLGEGAGMTVLARYGRPPRNGAATMRVALGLGGNASGELELDAPASAHVRPLAALVAERLTMALENDRLRRTDRRRQTWLTFLAEASELLAQSLDVQLTLALIPQLVVPRLGQWSAVHTTDAWGRLKLETAAHADEQSLPQLYASMQETGPDSVMSRLPGALRAGGQVPLPPPTEGYAIPLIARGQLLGTLSVGRHLERRHDPDEIAVLQDVARRAALAVDNARIHAERRNVARTLQRSLLPPTLPTVPGIGFGAAYVPTGDAAEVGGDFYDVVPLGGGGASRSVAGGESSGGGASRSVAGGESSGGGASRSATGGESSGGRASRSATGGESSAGDQWLVAIGDVSGKGVQAATVTGLVREVIRALVRGGRPLPEILERINETLVERGRGRYCTLALAAVRPVDHRLEVVLHLAGHERPVLVRADGRTVSAGSGGTALGLLDTITCPGETVWLEAGDSLVFYTDGVTERRRGRELFGGQRLRDAAAPLASYSAEVMAARLRTATIGFSAEPPRDDIALLVLRNDSPPADASQRPTAAKEPAVPPIRVRARATVPSMKESSE